MKIRSVRGLGSENHCVKPLAFQLLSDENIAREVLKGLRVRGCDVRTVEEEQGSGFAFVSSHHGEGQL